MNKDEIIEMLENAILAFPERSTGNECEDELVRISSSLESESRMELIHALREWINQRGKRTLIAVRIGADLKLFELQRDTEVLLEAVRAGKVFSPYYEEFLVPAIKRMGPK